VRGLDGFLAEYIVSWQGSRTIVLTRFDESDGKILRDEGGRKDYVWYI